MDTVEELLEAIKVDAAKARRFDRHVDRALIPLVSEALRAFVMESCSGVMGARELGVIRQIDYLSIRALGNATRKRAEGNERQ